MRLTTSTEWLFFHLWKKNPETNQSCLGVFIADTVIYRWAKPFFWYFTTKDGQILRKTKERVFVENFEEVFQQNNSPEDVSAMCLTSLEVTSKNGMSQEKIEFEYFNKKGLKDFLYQREKTLNCLLQKFIVPKNKHNQLIKVSWSPQFCLLTRKINVYSIDNDKVPFTDKLATFEGPEHLSNSDSIQSPSLSSDIEQLCINIVKHIQDVSGGNIQISRMVLYFKLDDKNRLWLLFCTSIKAREKFLNIDKNLEELRNKQESLEQDRISSPILKLCNYSQKDIATTNIHKKVKLSNQHYIEHLKYENNHVCANCEREALLYEIEFKHIIDAFNSKLYDLESIKIMKKVRDLEEEEKIIQNKVKNKKIKKPIKQYDLLLDEKEEENYYTKEMLNIPGLILKVWGKITEEQYNQLKINATWLQIPTKVCDDCYLKFTQNYYESKEEREIKQRQIQLKESTKVQQDGIFQYKQNTKFSKLKKEDEILQEFNQKYSKQNTKMAQSQRLDHRANSKCSSQVSSKQDINIHQDNEMQSSNAYLLKPPLITSQIQQQQQLDPIKKLNLHLNLEKLATIQENSKDISHKRTMSEKIQIDQIQTSRNYNNYQSVNITRDGTQTERYNSDIKSQIMNGIFKIKNHGNEKLIQFNPSKVYRNTDKLRLPKVRNNSSASSFTSNTTQSSSKNNIDFMLNTIKDLKSILGSEEFVQFKDKNEQQPHNQQQKN